MNEDELRAWEDEYRNPNLRMSAGTWKNHRWNPERHPGDKVGGVIVEDRVDPRTGKRMVVLDVPRRKRNVTVWVSFPDLIRRIEEAALSVGERIGITFVGQTESGDDRYEVSLPDREPPDRPKPDQPCGAPEQAPNLPDRRMD